MTNINSDVLATGVLAASRGVRGWVPSARVSAFLGTSVPGAGGGTGLAVVVQSVPRVRDKVALAIPVPQSALMAQLGQTNNYNHMTSVFAVGEGTAGPPPDREPA